MSVDYAKPFGWWGPLDKRPMSIPELTRAGNLDTALAALLWAMMARRPSVVVAAMPRLAGKTTTLTALLDLALPDVRRIYLRGGYERFEFIGHTEPASSYLLVPELSDHLPAYLWDDGARRALGLLNEGYALASTMHAESPEEVVAMLHEDLGVDQRTLGNLTAVITLHIGADPFSVPNPQRRVRAVHLVQPSGGDFTQLTQWRPSDDTFYVGTTAIKALADRLGLDPSHLQTEVKDRERFLATHVSAPLDENFRKAAQSYNGRIAPNR